MKTEVLHMLREELSRRVDKNPRYSMRAYASSLGLSIGALSGLLSGKRPLTAKSAEALCNKLGVNPSKKMEIILAVLNEKQNGSFHAPNASAEQIEIQEDMFRIIADWYHYAILQLVRTDKYLSNPNHANPRWAARQLQITETEAKLAIARLLKLKLLETKPNGLLKRTKGNLATANKNITSTAHKKMQKQLLPKTGAVRFKFDVSLESNAILVVQ
jgi:uncharacterized protein (TIGR02147 family)